jgi:tetratricopeptide (TPR) repeat protein
LAVFAPGELAHDRYFYVPGFGAALLVSLAFEKLASGKVVWRLPQRWLLATLALLIPLCYGTANAVRYWANDNVLYRHAYAIAPRNFLVRANYARELVIEGDYSGGLSIFQDLLKERPDSHIVNLNMGRALYLLGLYPAAEHYLEYTRQLAPQLPDSYLELALIDLRTNRLPQAEAKLRHAIELRPEEPMFHFALGTVLAQQGNCSEARPQFATALALNSEFPKAREQMNKCQSNAVSAQGDPPPSVKGSQPAPALGAQGKTGVAADPPSGDPRPTKPGG